METERVASRQSGTRRWPPRNERGLIEALERLDTYAYVVDEDCNIQYANPAVRRDFGSPEGRKCYDYFCDRDEVCLGCRNRDRKGTAQRVWRSSEKGRTYEVIATPLTHPDGSTAMLEICHPVAGCRQVEDDRSDLDSRFRDFVRNSRDLLWRLDADGRFSFVSPAAKSMLGYEPEELTGDTFERVLTEESLHEVRTLLNHPGGGPLQTEGIILELTHRRKDGTTFVGESRWEPILGPAGELIEVEGITRDVTEWRRRCEAMAGGQGTRAAAGAKGADARRTPHRPAGFAGIVASDPRMLEVFEAIDDVSTSDVSVLIQGESGTGKELVASAIHERGPRARKAFVPVNCSALPENLLESELFGHVRGAFSGAIRDKKGRFELAHEGTLFLDEVGDLSPSVQVSLLRVLQEGTLERVGGEETIRVDVRVISASNKNLANLVALGNFREDLFYRLCVIPINMPPLRERRGDIPVLAKHILERIQQDPLRRACRLSEEVLDALVKYHWPGNVRELQNALYYASVKCKGDTLQPGHLPPSVSAAAVTPRLTSRRGRKPKVTVEAVHRAIAESGGNKVVAAQKLGVCRATLYKYLTS